jgi:hypothetical protein
LALLSSALLFIHAILIPVIVLLLDIRLGMLNAGLIPHTLVVNRGLVDAASYNDIFFSEVE